MPEIKNFDLVHPEERSFILGGETFHWQPIWWRDFGVMLEEAYEEVSKRQREAEDAEKRGEESDRLTVNESYEQLIDRNVRYLVEGDGERFRALVNDPSKRISSLQLTELRDWLQEVANNRPTEQPSPSDAGRGSDARTLQVV